MTETKPDCLWEPIETERAIATDDFSDALSQFHDMALSKDPQIAAQGRLLKSLYEPIVNFIESEIDRDDIDPGLLITICTVNFAATIVNGFSPILVAPLERDRVDQLGALFRDKLAETSFQLVALKNESSDKS